MGRSPCFAGNSPSLLVELLVVAPTRSLRSLDKVVPIEKPVSPSLCVSDSERSEHDFPGKPVIKPVRPLYPRLHAPPPQPKRFPMKGSSTTRSCATPNCLRPIRRLPWSASASRFCELCRARRRRHGDAAVRSGIWLKDLRPYIVRIRRLIRRGNPDKVEQALITLHTF